MVVDCASFKLPAEVYTLSNRRAFSTLFKAIFLCVLGCYCVSVSPWYLWWAGALVSGCAMSWLYSVGIDCAQRAFFRHRWANHLVGVLCTLLMLRPFSSLRLPYPSERMAIAARLRRIGSCFSVKDLKTLYAEGDWRRTAMPIIDLTTVCIFAAVFFPLVIYFLGWTGLIKYWLVPFVDMHLRIGTFTSSILSRVPYLALFHPEISPLLPAGVQKMLNFPSYNVSKAHAHITRRVNKSEDNSTATTAAATAAGNKKISNTTSAASSASSASSSSAGTKTAKTNTTITSLLHTICAPIDSMAFGRMGRDTAAIIYAVGALVAASIYQRQFAAVMLIPTVIYIASAAIFRRPAEETTTTATTATATTAPAVAAATAPAVVVDVYAKPHYFNRIFLGIMHVLGVIGLWYCYTYPNVKTMVFAVALYHFGAMGITAGAHRLWAHRTYSASPFMRGMLMFMNLFAAQGSIYKWVRDHRLHHKFVDTEKDPHNSELGFWWSHVGWLLWQKSKEVTDAGKQVYMDDILQDKFVMWQAKNNNWASPLCAFVVPAIIALAWGDPVGGYFVAGVLRFVYTLHATWFVNSIAHLWGSRPYVQTIKPRENLFVSLCADGEGWHNYHHAYPYDYSTNEHGVLQYNPTTLFINICAMLGLVRDRRRAKLPKGDAVIDPATLPVMSKTVLETCGKQCACILAIKGLVYDLTTFEDNHPAGAAILKDQYGKDATAAFYDGDHKHTDVAINLMKAYVVARLEG